MDALKEQAWCNFEFLLARLHSSSVHGLLNDLDLTLASVLDADIHLVLQGVAASTRVLSLDPLQLASELIGRLRQLNGVLLSSFYLCCHRHLFPVATSCFFLSRMCDAAPTSLSI